MSVADDAVTVDTSPARISGVMAVLASIVAVGAATLVSMLALIFGILGILGIAAGATVGSRPAVSIGSASLVVALLIGGGFGTPVEMMLVAIIAVVLAWDLGHYAIEMGEQLGRTAPTHKAELAHAGGSTFVGILAAGFGYAVYTGAPTEQPISALIFLLIGAVFFAWVIRT